MPVTEFPSSLHIRRILRVGALDAKTNSRILELDGGSTAVATNVHLKALANPQVGDYWVIPSAGHAYLLTKSTFATTYGAAEQR